VKEGISPENLHRLLASAPEGWREFYRFLALTGCRKGEALALTGAQVTREDTRCVVRIEPHALPNAGYWHPKTTNSTRAIVLPTDAVPPASAGGWLLLPMLTRPVHNMVVDRALRDHTIDAGIPHITSHAFRRMRITQALLAGAEPVALSRAVGHRSLLTTLGYLREIPMLCELPDLDAEPVPNPTAAAWAQATVSKKRTQNQG
jgi:integrase